MQTVSHTLLPISQRSPKKLNLFKVPFAELHHGRLFSDKTKAVKVWLSLSLSVSNFHTQNLFSIYLYGPGRRIGALKVIGSMYILQAIIMAINRLLQ